MKIAIFLAVFLVFCGFGAWWFLGRSSSPKISQKSAIKQVVEKKPVVTSLKADVLFTGNSFWGRYTNDQAKKTAEPYKFPFARLGEFNRNKYDAWVTCLECPTTKEGVKMTSAQMEATLTFNCDPAYLPEFAKWFDVVSLANNHTDNMGVDGFSETQKALGEQKIQYFGHYDPEKLDDLCDVVSLPVRAKYDDGKEQKGKLPVAMCGYHFFYKLPTAEAIKKITEYSKVMPTIVLPHGGTEYKPAPDEIKINLFRSFIDAGADIVIGDHPHWVQTTEAYKNHLIVYSMGNFMFDQQSNQEVTRSAAIKVELKTENGQLKEWLNLAEKCQGYRDDCLALAKTSGFKKLDLKYNFEVIATDNKGYQTHPAPELQTSIEGRLNWQATKQALNN